MRIDPANPEHFVWAGTGEHYFWNGNTTYYLMGWNDDAVIRAAIDRLALLKNNRLRVLVYGRNNDRPWGQPVKATRAFKLYLNPWPAARPDDVKNPGFDLTRFNVPFWQKYERMLRHARERDGNRCQYTGRLLHPDEGNLDHVVPRSRGGADTWENLVWAAKEVNQRKADRLPHEAGLKLLTVPRAPQEKPVSVLLRNAHGVAEWKLFLNE